MSDAMAEYWSEVEAVVREFHAMENPFDKWIESVDDFVKDILDLAKAAYVAGQFDTLEDIHEEVRKLERGLDDEL